MEDWKEGLPEQMRDLPFIGKSATMDEAIGHIKNAADSMGNSLRMPSESASDEDKKAFTQRVLEKMPELMPIPDPDNEEAYNEVLTRLGKPKDPDSYKLPEIDGFDWPEDTLKELRDRASETGMTQRQFANYAKKLGTAIRDGNAAAQTKLEEQQQQLKGEWGDALEQRQNQIGQYLEQTEAPQSLRDAVKNGKADPATMKWLHSMVKASGKEGQEGTDQGGPDGNTGRVTPDEARAEIQEILNNPDYFNAGSPRQKVLMQRMQELQKFANAG